MAGGPLVGTQVGEQPDNAWSPDKALLIVPINDEEWTAGLPLTISFVICIRLIKITMDVDPQGCSIEVAAGFFFGLLDKE